MFDGVLYANIPILLAENSRRKMNPSFPAYRTVFYVNSILNFPLYGTFAEV